MEGFHFTPLTPSSPLTFTPHPQLLSEFHVNSDIAFFLARPMFHYLIGASFSSSSFFFYSSISSSSSFCSTSFSSFSRIYPTPL